MKTQSYINILIRLSNKAHEKDLPFPKYVKIANNISDILVRIENDYGMDYLMYIIYTTSNILGHSIGPLNGYLTKRLISKGCIITKIIY